MICIICRKRLTGSSRCPNPLAHSQRHIRAAIRKNKLAYEACRRHEELWPNSGWKNIGETYQRRIKNLLHYSNSRRSKYYHHRKNDKDTNS